MWLSTENVNILYQIAYLQYSTQRFPESVSNIEILETRVKDEDKISLNKTDGTIQEIAFKAAVLNLRGLIAIEEGKNEEAKSHFTNALVISPDFDAAKVSLDELNKG